jgi:phenylacetate-CoA ligase
MPSLVERIYWKSPVWLQQVMISTWGVGWYYRRYNRRFRKALRDFHSRDDWTMEQFHAYQERKLAELFEHAWKTSYYPSVFREAGVARGMDPWEALRRMPLLPKSVLQIHARDLLSSTNIPRRTKASRSSGTTGTPTEIFNTPQLHATMMALGTRRSYHVAGVNYRDRRVMFGARKVCAYDQDRPPFWRYSLIENLAYGSIYHLTPRFLPYYLEFLRRFQPVLVTGYPNALRTIARYALDANDLPAVPKCIVTSSESLTDEARADIEAAFRCRVYDQYGAVESCVFAAQCRQGRYHLSPDVGILELLDMQGKPVPPGQPGEVICTGFLNTLQPLIRYRLGDSASWAVDQTCSCGCQMPILEKIEGRAEDLCITPDGRQVARFTYVFKGISTIKEAQVVQEEPDRFVIYLTPGEGFSQADEELLKKNMRQHVGDVRIEIKPVDGIPRSAAGKFRPTLCKLSPEQRRQLLGRAVASPQK